MKFASFITSYINSIYATAQEAYFTHDKQPAIHKDMDVHFAHLTGLEIRILTRGRIFALGLQLSVVCLSKHNSMS